MLGRRAFDDAKKAPSGLHVWKCRFEVTRIRVPLYHGYVSCFTASAINIEDLPYPLRLVRLRGLCLLSLSI